MESEYYTRGDVDFAGLVDDPNEQDDAEQAMEDQWSTDPTGREDTEHTAVGDQTENTTMEEQNIEAMEDFATPPTSPRGEEQEMEEPPVTEIGQTIWQPVDPFPGIRATTEPAMNFDEIQENLFFQAPPFGTLPQDVPTDLSVTSFDITTASPEPAATLTSQQDQPSHSASATEPTATWIGPAATTPEQSKQHKKTDFKNAAKTGPSWDTGNSAAPDGGW